LNLLSSSQVWVGVGSGGSGGWSLDGSGLGSGNRSLDSGGLGSGGRSLDGGGCVSSGWLWLGHLNF
jgi:hypothetical protein